MTMGWLKLGNSYGLHKILGLHPLAENCGNYVEDDSYYTEGGNYLPTLPSLPEVPREKEHKYAYLFFTEGLY